MIHTLTKIGPQDHGRQMSLEEFEPAEVQEGYLYELGRGVVVVSDVPKVRHMRQIVAARRQFAAYDLANPGRVFAILSGSECKILLAELQSERHPALAIYLTAPPEEDDPWSMWIPEIVIEVVSPGSELRDYVEKREEYFDFGVKEYWIIDADKKAVLILCRSRGTWSDQTVKPGKTYETKLLPGFRFDCRPVFDVAETLARKRTNHKKKGG